MFFTWLRWYVDVITRKLLKIVARLLTGRSEIERLCASGEDEQQLRRRMVMGVRSSLWRSRQLSAVRGRVFSGAGVVFSVEECVGTIVKRKRMTAGIGNLRTCLQELNGVNALIHSVRDKCATAYDSGSAEHERMLERLWSALKPEVRRANGRYTSEWGEIGFQGNDPATDFRGMGCFGLEQLLYFAERHTATALITLEISSRPQKHFPFAITGINLTAFLVRELRRRGLDCELLSAARTQDGEGVLMEIYCQWFLRFARLWEMSRVRDLMDFPRIFGSFKETITAELAQQN